MTTTTTKVIVAVNALFSVCSDRVNDFMFSFRKQIDDLENKNPSSSSSTTTLIQAILGEDLDDPCIFHCHLKFECSSSILEAQDDIKTRQSIFVKEPHKIWQEFESSPHSFKSKPEVYAWVVEPSTTTPTISNPKSQPFDDVQKQQKEQQQQQQQQQSSCCCCCVNANLYIQPQHRDEFLNVLENARINSIQEKYCVEYQYGESLTTPNTFHVHQEYWGSNDGQNGLDQHCQTKHYQKWKEFSSKGPFTKSPVGYTFKTVLETAAREHSADERRGNDNNIIASLCRHKGFPFPRYTVTTTNHKVIILDGGNGHELKQRGVINDGSFLAGLLANENQPDVVKAAHTDFCDIGCHVITTNSFVAVPVRIKKDFQLVNPNDAQQRTRDLIVSAVLCARDVAREQKELHNRSIQVAGTVPPLTECYIARDVPESIEDLVVSYKFILSTLINAGVDILLAETLSTQREAIAIVRALSQIIRADKRSPDSNNIHPPLWISFTIDDFDEPASLRSGELLSETIDAILDEAKQECTPLDAVGVNCASPKAVTRAIPYVVAGIKKRNLLNNSPRIIAYANAFQTTTSEWLASLLTDKSTDLPMPNPPDSDDDVYDSHGVIMPEEYA